MEAPERKKLKSTYQPSPALAAPLPPGWSEHTAPTGHKYFYNAQTKQSTYTRPAPASAPPAPIPTPPSAFQAPPFAVPPHHGYQQQHDYNAYPFGAGAPTYQQFSDPNPNRKPYQRRPPPEDRPKKKATIPDCAPWILIYTKLGRRFVHNTETKESLWKFPPDVMKAVVEFDRLELEKKLLAKDEGTGANNVPVGENARNSRRRRSASLQREDEAALAAELAALEDDRPAKETAPAAVAVSRPEGKTPGMVEGEDAGDESSEYEEIEVTDDEDDQDQPAPTAGQGEDPVEFGEDDIAYQLAQMNAEYGLDPGEYDDGLDESYEEGAEGLPLTDQDQTALFHDLLSDFAISPFSPWETLVENDSLISDARWTILPTTKARKESWDSWCRLTLAALKAQRAAQEKQDPKIPYLGLLHEKATPKLYWPEFKRKFKREAVMNIVTARFGDKEREKLYREHISRLKLPSATLKSELAALLRAQPVEELHRASTLHSLPKEVLGDVRYISLPAHIRDPLILAHISTLPPKPEGADAVSAEERAEREKVKKERERRERALRERERKVDEEKRRRERDVRNARGVLREGERELEQAMRIGRDGLRAQLGDRGDDDMISGDAAAGDAVVVAGTE